MKVGLVTTLSSQHRCGVAEYARMLGEALPKDIELTEIGGPYEVGALLPRVLAGGYDVVHFNYESGFLGIFTPGTAAKFRGTKGSKLLLTLHDNWPRNNRERYPFVTEMDGVVIHQPSEDLEVEKNFWHIPHGIPVLEPSSWSEENTTIGIGGFPLAQKRTEMVAAAAALLGKETKRITGCTMVCPESQHVNTHIIKDTCRRYFPEVRYETRWLPQRQAMEILATNLVNVYPMKDGKSGVSASVRMALGTGSYMVLSRCEMFRDLYEPEYEREIGWIEGEVTPRTIADAVHKVLEEKKRPRKILEDMNWKRVGQMYAGLYDNLLVGRREELA